jgi:hypothetical protein
MFFCHTSKSDNYNPNLLLFCDNLKSISVFERLNFIEMLF